MDHLRIILAQYRKKAETLKMELAKVETVIQTLGGSTETKARNVGWPKGKKRGPRKAKVAPVPVAKPTIKATPKGADLAGAV